ncbi:hypothetical protein HY745_06065 [Candidatus Desantisbacteria bacterium]|nr:hypothetical protein [Candidatus Desantisbacteria bacterium]
MIKYLSIKGIYDRGSIRLLEKIKNKEIAKKTEVRILIPVKHKIGIKISDFIKKINYCSIGGDALTESEDIYNE